MGFDDGISTWLQLSDFACLFFNNLFSYFHKVKVRISVCVCFKVGQFHEVVALNSFQTWPCQIYSKFLYTLDISNHSSFDLLSFDQDYFSFGCCKFLRC